jgi:DNA polymerase-3 subunit delta
MASCYPNQLAGKLKNPLPGLVLLWGDDAGALRQAAQQVIQAAGLDPDDPFAADKLTLNDLAADPTLLADRAASVAFGVARRLVWLTGVSGDENAREILPPLTEAVKTILSRPLEGCLVVLPLPKLLEKTSALVRAVEGHAQALAVRFFADNARDIQTYLQNAFRAAGKTPEPAALSLLGQHLGADREVAAREVEKLLLYAADQPAITEADVRACVAGAIPADVFRLAEAVGARDASLADRLTQHLMAQGEDLNAAFVLAVGYLQKLREARRALDDGEAGDAVLAKAGKGRAPRPVQQEFLRQARAYPAGRLETLAAYALETLTASRSGLAPPELPLSRALLALAS